MTRAETDQAISDTMALLERWDCLKDCSQGDKIYIFNSLISIAKGAQSDLMKDIHKVHMEHIDNISYKRRSTE